MEDEESFRIAHDSEKKFFHSRVLAINVRARRQIFFIVPLYAFPALLLRYKD